MAAYERHEKQVAKELAKKEHDAEEAEYEEEFKEWYDEYEALQRELQEAGFEDQDAIPPQRPAKKQHDEKSQDHEHIYEKHEHYEAHHGSPHQKPNSQEASKVSTKIPSAYSTLPQSTLGSSFLGAGVTRPLTSDRVEQAGSSQAPFMSPTSTLSSSMLYSGSHQNWASQGFAAPFAQAQPHQHHHEDHHGHKPMPPPSTSQMAPGTFTTMPPSVRKIGEVEGETTFRAAPLGTTPGTFGTLPPTGATPATFGTMPPTGRSIGNIPPIGPVRSSLVDII